MIDLTKRTEKVLSTIVDLYLQTRWPVGSRALAQVIDLSPASLRSVMADLGQAQLLRAPHRSAGRIPTGKALRWYMQDPAHLWPLNAQDTILVQSCLTEHATAPMGQSMGSDLAQTLADLCQAAGLFFAVPGKPSQGKNPNGRAICQSITAVRGHGHLLAQWQEQEDAKRLCSLFGQLENSLFFNDLLMQMAQLCFPRQSNRSTTDSSPDQALRHKSSEEKNPDAAPPKVVKTSIIDNGNCAGRNKILDRGLHAPWGRPKPDDQSPKGGLCPLPTHAQNRAWCLLFEPEVNLAGLEDFCVALAPYATDHIQGFVGVLGLGHMDYRRIIPIIEVMAQSVQRTFS
jgi:hypothetical protein